MGAYKRPCRYGIAVLILVNMIVSTDAANKVRLTWVNGIGYSVDHMGEEAKMISKCFGGQPVKWCHNPTMMTSEEDLRGYLFDLTQAGTQKLGRITSEVSSLVQHLKDAVMAVGKKGTVVHIAHSQGALITSLAARQLSPLEMNSIEVIAFGGAAALRRTNRTPFRRCINYYSVNDPLLWVVPEAEQALRSGYVADNEFCFLAPKEGDPIADHKLTGATYAQALAWEGRNFQQRFHSLPYRSSRAIALTSVLVLTRLMELLAELLRILIQLLVAGLHYAIEFGTKLVLPILLVITALYEYPIGAYQTWNAEQPSNEEKDTERNSWILSLLQVWWTLLAQERRDIPSATLLD